MNSDELLFALGIAVSAAAAVSIALVGQKRLLIGGYAISTIGSFAVYALLTHGRESFHTAIMIALGISLVTASLVALRATSVAVRWGLVIVCVAGAATPPLVFLGTLFAACSGHGGCFD